MAEQREVSVIIPTYNEAGGIEQLISALTDLFARANIRGEIVVVDDNSPDGTGTLVDSLATRYPVRCVHRAGKLGLASAVIDGWATSSSPILGVMDADFSHDVRAIPPMVRALESGYDLAVGSRYVRGGSIENWPLRRKIISLVAIGLAKPLTRIRDITSGFFLVRRKALDTVRLDPIGFKIGLEVIAKAKYDRFIEIPYAFTDRVAGTSKLNQREILHYLQQLGRIYKLRLFGDEKVATPDGATATDVKGI